MEKARNSNFPKRNMSTVLLSLDDAQFFLIEGERGTDIQSEFSSAMKEAEADKVRKTIADIPQRYLDAHGLKLIPLETVLRLDKRSIYSGLEEELGVDVPRCGSCSFYKDGCCRKNGKVNPTEKAYKCKYYICENGFFLIAESETSSRRKGRIIAIFTLRHPRLSPFTDAETREIADILAKKDEDIAASLRILPEGTKLDIMRR